MRARSFILVAGAWHGAWCWERLTPWLEASGHRVLTPELPGLDQAAGAADVTLDTWARYIASLARAEPSPVLVGHSRAGLVISRAAELEPRSVARLVYLSAYLLPAGATLAAVARDDAGSLVPPNMVPAASGATCTLRAEFVREAFYGDCDDATVEWARARLAPEPLKPLVTPMRVSTERFGAVPRAYIECTRDRAVTLASQRRMQAVLPCDPVFTLDADHSPFLSQPRELAAALQAAA